MSLHIDKIDVSHFRGYDTLRFEGLGHLTVFVGPNAVGKTNLVEAIQLLTSAESFRKPSWPEVVSWGMEACMIKARLVDDNRDIEHKMVVEQGSRLYEVNGKRKNAAAIRGTCPSVLFIPDHLSMVKSSSAARRDAIDSLASQLSKNYSTLRREYAQALKQRNLLIKDGIHEGPLFDAWDERACITGARLCVGRIRLFNRISDHICRIYSDLVNGETLTCVYLPSWKRFDSSGRQVADIASFQEAVPLSAEALEVDEVQGLLSKASVDLVDQEIRRKTSLVGPHKDEISFYINGRNARMFASQGQQRTIVLAWKLAEVELVREFNGQDPVLLLDDVMSELDSSRRDALTSFIDKSAQTFITTTNLGYFSPELLEQAHVIKLPIEGSKILYGEV